MSQNLLDKELHNAGFTLTKPRKIVTKKILELTSNHLDGDLCCESEEIDHSHTFGSEELVSSAPDIGRATIFRILKNIDQFLFKINRFCIFFLTKDFELIPSSASNIIKISLL